MSREQHWVTKANGEGGNAAFNDRALWAQIVRRYSFSQDSIFVSSPPDPESVCCPLKYLNQNITAGLVSSINNSVL